jgi:probable addiction module antidote protein
LQDGDPQLVAAASGDIARAKGMSQVARDSGLGRESLYKSLSSSGNPELATVLKVISTLGLELHVTAVDGAKMAVQQAPRVDRPPQLSAKPPQAHCLPLRGSVRNIRQSPKGPLP